jgi:hypothetical protein
MNIRCNSLCRERKTARSRAKRSVSSLFLGTREIDPAQLLGIVIVATGRRKDAGRKRNAVESHRQAVSPPRRAATRASGRATTGGMPSSGASLLVTMVGWFVVWRREIPVSESTTYGLQSSTQKNLGKPGGRVGVQRVDGFRTGPSPKLA